MRSEDTRIWFYGFVVGTVLMLMPVPNFFFWKDVIEHVESIFQYVGFVFFAVCGVALLVRVIRSFIGK
jgi:putative Mn2+ efflux pump MntP